ncbi:MAG: hypothetical protein HY903_18480 [Deltaproteobacteria bacterium]|nr:hypothetical protein [Deltaproteobacteria bacterium]
MCGQEHTYPEVLNTGVRPSAAAAERSRSRAFRAAGLVKNIGGFALGLAFLGILFFPLALAGAAGGVYVLTMLRGPVGRYSGRRSAIVAVVVGISVFLAEGVFAVRYVKERHRQRLEALQTAVDDDLRALLRAERLYRADNDTYGTFKEFRFKPRQGKYTLYLGLDDFVGAERDGEKVVDPLPVGLVPAVSESSFTAMAVANIDGDGFLDVWTINDRGTVAHLQDDVEDQLLTPETTPAAGAPAGSDAGQGSEANVPESTTPSAAAPDAGGPEPVPSTPEAEGEAAATP